MSSRLFISIFLLSCQLINSMEPQRLEPVYLSLETFEYTAENSLCTLYGSSSSNLGYQNGPQDTLQTIIVSPESQKIAAERTAKNRGKNTHEKRTQSDKTNNQKSNKITGAQSAEITGLIDKQLCIKMIVLKDGSVPFVAIKEIIDRMKIMYQKGEKKEEGLGAFALYELYIRRENEQHIYYSRSKSELEYNPCALLHDAQLIINRTKREWAQDKIFNNSVRSMIDCMVVENSSAGKYNISLEPNAQPVDVIKGYILNNNFVPLYVLKGTVEKMQKLYAKAEKTKEGFGELVLYDLKSVVNDSQSKIYSTEFGFDFINSLYKENLFYKDKRNLFSMQSCKKNRFDAYLKTIVNLVVRKENPSDRDFIIDFDINSIMNFAKQEQSKIKKATDQEGLEKKKSVPKKTSKEKKLKPSSTSLSRTASFSLSDGESDVPYAPY